MNYSSLFETATNCKVIVLPSLLQRKLHSSQRHHWGNNIVYLQGSTNTLMLFALRHNYDQLDLVISGLYFHLTNLTCFNCLENLTKAVFSSKCGILIFTQISFSLSLSCVVYWFQLHEISLVLWAICCHCSNTQYLLHILKLIFCPFLSLSWTHGHTHTYQNTTETDACLPVQSRFEWTK